MIRRITGVLELAISDAILSEVERVLAHRFRWTPRLVTEALIEIGAYTVRIHPSEKLDVIKDDGSDNRILECAVRAGSECIASGDRQLLRIRTHEGIRILRPSELLDLHREESA